MLVLVYEPNSYKWDDVCTKHVSVFLFFLVVEAVRKSQSTGGNAGWCVRTTALCSPGIPQNKGEHLYVDICMSLCLCVCLLRAFMQYVWPISHSPWCTKACWSFYSVCVKMFMCVCSLLLGLCHCAASVCVRGQSDADILYMWERKPSSR